LGRLQKTILSDMNSREVVGVGGIVSAILSVVFLVTIAWVPKHVDVFAGLSAGFIALTIGCVVVYWFLRDSEGRVQEEPQEHA